MSENVFGSELGCACLCGKEREKEKERERERERVCVSARHEQVEDDFDAADV